jgi:putative phosphoribosyl transferase
MGAIASGGIRVLSDEIVSALAIPERLIATVAANEEAELARRERAYRDDRPLPQIEGKIVILIDDGLATGSTMRAAAAAVGSQNPERLVIAVPVAPSEICQSLGQVADEVVCGAAPEPFLAVGNWYRDFSQMTDEDVRGLLAMAMEALHQVPRR